MAYKNSNTTSSIKQEYFNWNYFSHSMHKLGVAKGGGVNINPKVVPKEEVDWMKTLGTVSKGIKSIVEDYTEDSFREADDYLKTHSLEEYQADIRDNKIPFQRDPVAMNRLKYQHGKMAFRLSEQDFQNRVDRGEFNGWDPMDVDAEHFAHSRKALDEVKESFGYSPEDSAWFDKGFFVDSPNSRVGVLVQNEEATSKWNVEQAKIIDMSEVKASIDDPNSDALAIIDTVQRIFDPNQNPKLAHYSPEEKANILADVVSEISGRADGTVILSELEKWKPNFLGKDQTVRDMIGPVAWDKALRDAGNKAWIHDADAWSNQVKTVNNDISLGDVEAVQLGLNDALDRSGGVVNNEVKFYQSSLESAINVRDRLLVKQKADQEAQLKDLKATVGAGLYLDSMSSPLPTNPMSIVGTDKEHVKRAFAEGLRSGAFTFDDALEMACNPTGDYNPAKEYITKIGNNVVDSIQSDILALTQSNSAKLEKPTYLDTIYSLYLRDPRKFAIAFGGMGNYDRDTIVAVMQSNALGMDYNRTVASLKKRKEMGETQEGRRELQRIYDNVVRGTDWSKDDAYAVQSISSKTFAYMSVGMSRGDALDRAREDFEGETLLINGSAVPANLFSVNGARPEVVREYMEKVIQKDIKEAHKNAENGVMAYYSPLTNTFDVIDTETRDLIKSYGPKDVQSSFMSYIDEESIKLSQPKKKPTIFSSTNTLFGGD